MRGFGRILGIALAAGLVLAWVLRAPSSEEPESVRLVPRDAGTAPLESVEAVGFGERVGADASTPSAGDAAPEPAEARPASQDALDAGVLDRQRQVVAEELDWLRNRFRADPSLANAQHLATKSAQIVLEASGAYETHDPDAPMTFGSTETLVPFSVTTPHGVRHFQARKEEFPELAELQARLFDGSPDECPPELQQGILDLASVAEQHVRAGFVDVPFPPGSAAEAAAARKE